MSDDVTIEIVEKSEDRISPKMAAFVEHYLYGTDDVRFNAMRSAEKAGYSIKSRAAGNHLLRKPPIARAIRRFVIESQARLDVTGDDIRNGLAHIAFSTVKPQDGGPSWRDRTAAFDKLAKILGLYHEHHIFTGMTLEQLLAQAGKIEATLPPAPVPLRLVNGGKQE